MKMSEELLMRYVDGELDATASAAIERDMRDDPALAQAVARARSLRDRVRDRYAPVAGEPVPQRLLDAANGRRHDRAHTRRAVPLRTASRAGRRWRQGAALAASLALGVVVSSWLRPADEAPIRMAADGLQAGEQLAAALDATLTTAAPGARIVPGLSFVATDDRYCRTFTLRGPENLAGLACRDADRWRIEAVAGTGAAGGELRLASSALPPAVLAEVDERIDGEPLDAAGEQRARAAGWRR